MLATHGDRKYQTGEQIGEVAEWPMLRVERRRLAPGAQGSLTLECTEVALLLSGQATVRRTGDGETQEAVARPGTAWICPAGTHESHVEVSGRMECLHLFLPATLLDKSALADYDIDPARAQLAYAGGFVDPVLLQIGSAFGGLMERAPQPTDRLFVDGMQAALAGHLIGSYAVDRWRPVGPAPTFDPRRLKRVLDFIEARLATEITLADLAAEACLSAFHFARLFRDATGLPPHRYVTERRVQAAKEKLARNDSSLVEVALDTGFGSQANFTRVFRKVAGLTPGQYRHLNARG